MIWILSTVRVLHDSVLRWSYRAFLPLLLLLLSGLSGAACRGDDAGERPGDDAELDDSDASPIAGAIQGAFAVSSTGEASYHIPLIPPPGAAGMAPSLGVSYNSASGDGMLGRGFSLSGLSAITRCARTVAQDGEIGNNELEAHMVKFLNCLEPASEEQIDEVEKKLGFRFPDALRRLFREANGGRPDPCIYRDDKNDTDVSECLALREGKGSALWTYELLVQSKRLVPERFFPFGVDSGGDCFFVDCSSTDARVCLYVHDTNFEHVRLLDIGLEEFWSSLVEE
jgi:hypothetical protein